MKAGKDATTHVSGGGSLTRLRAAPEQTNAGCEDAGLRRSVTCFCEISQREPLRNED